MMRARKVRPRALPARALLTRYSTGGGYTDCFTLDVPGVVSHAEYVAAFYTTWLFKLERWLLARLVAKPSTDAEARELAAGGRTDFSAWSVEDRAADQVLLCDFRGQTRSWLMVETLPEPGAQATRLFFGSAVVPARDARGGPPALGHSYRALLGFHKIYSRLLLRAAGARLVR